jgi:hypothetical protein
MSSRIALSSVRAASTFSVDDSDNFGLLLYSPSPSGSSYQCVCRCTHNEQYCSSLPLPHSRTLSSTSNTPPPPPAERASEIINKLPSSPGLITKTGTAILGTGLLATAISQELYVMNEETVVAVGTFILFGYLAKVLPPFLVLFEYVFIAVFFRLLESRTATGRKRKSSASKMFSTIPALNIHRLSGTASLPSRR